MNKRKLLEKILAGPKNVRFSDLVALLKAAGFQQIRIRGSHQLFAHPQIPELVNLQKRGAKAKPYHVRQCLLLIEQYNLRLGDDS